LNPLGLDVTFVQPPRPGAIRATLTGDQPETVGRLAQTILLGDYPLTQPVVNVIDEFSSIGGGVLKVFHTDLRPGAQPGDILPGPNANRSFSRPAAAPG
jgi:hypothetical protein